MANATNEVGGSFILGLFGRAANGSEMPPTKLVDRSYPTY
jgi:hypothetical protein